MVESPVHGSLRVTDAQGITARVSLTKAESTIGRTAECDVRLDHPMVSRRHAVLRMEGGRLRLKDLQSRNGSVVNGLPVSEHILAAGDQITIGPFTLTYMPSSPDGDTRLTRLGVADATVGRITTLNDADSPRVLAAQLIVLNQLGQSLLTTESAEGRRKVLCEIITGNDLKGRWAAVVRIKANEDDRAPLLLGESRVNSAPRTSYLSQGVLRAIRDKRQAILAGNQGPAVDLMISMSPDVMPLATIACPLEMSDDTIDMLYVELPPEYGTTEWLALVILASKQFLQAEAAWAARKQAQAHALVQRDLDHARQIQMRLVPRTMEFLGLDIAVGFTPCRSVGGDYVDIVNMSDGRVLLAVADVCGKGLPAALVSSSIHTFVHTAVRAKMTLCDMMTALNEYLREIQGEDSFVTMVVMAIDPASGHVEYVNAGHPHPLAIAKESTRLFDRGDNFPLRVDAEPAILVTDNLGVGELLVLYTDGLTEMKLAASDLLGIQGLATHIQSLHRPAQSSNATATELHRTLDEILAGNEPDDDRTFLLVQRK